MKDLIERQVIINELKSWLKVDGYSEGELNIIKAVLYELENAPSAQPEIIRCDECRYYIRKSHRCEPLGLITCDGFWCKQAERKKDG